MEPLLTTEEIAEYLRVEVVTVRRLVTRGELTAYRIGGEFRFMAPDIEAFVKGQRVTTINDSTDTFSKFTERARNVFAFANQEARELSHHYIGTEHLLLGIIREGESVATQALQRAGLDLLDVRERIMKIVKQAGKEAMVKQVSLERSKGPIKAAMQEVFGIGRTPNPFGELALTRRVKKVLELAVDEALRLGHHYVGTEHLLLAMIFEGDGVAAQVLIKECGLQLSTTRELVLQILQETSTMTLPEIPEQAATLLSENEQEMRCSRCGAPSPEYFRYCFNCGLKFP